MSISSYLKMTAFTASTLILIACGGASIETDVAEAPRNAVPASTANTDSTAPAPVSIGVFTGRSDHITTGGVSIVKKGDEYHLMLAADFSLDGAPDPVVALGNNGNYKVENKLGPLAKVSGQQSYVIPANLNPADFTEAYIWCEKFSVPLGIAPLKSASYGS